MKFKLKNIENTNKFGYFLGTLLKRGDVVSLNGDLGSGKTTLTKAIGTGMGIESYITSPTFTIINEYPGDIYLYHFDTYRLEAVEEAEDLGFDDYLFGQGVCVVEWAEKIEKFLPEETIYIKIDYLGENERELEILEKTNRSKEIAREMKNCENTWN